MKEIIISTQAEWDALPEDGFKTPTRIIITGNVIVQRGSVGAIYSEGIIKCHTISSAWLLNSFNADKYPHQFSS